MLIVADEKGSSGTMGLSRRPEAIVARRSAAVVLFGVIVMILSVVGFRVVDAINSPPTRRLVLMKERLLPGEELRVEQLRQIRISGGGAVEGVSPDEVKQLIGRVARRQLDPGMVLQEAMLFDRTELVPGKAVVALALRRGQSPPLREDDSVLLVGEGRPTTGPVQVPANVRSVKDDPGSQDLFIMVEVRLSDSPLVALEGSQGRLAVIQLPARPS